MATAANMNYLTWPLQNLHGAQFEHYQGLTAFFHALLSFSPHDDFGTAACAKRVSKGSNSDVALILLFPLSYYSSIRGTVLLSCLYLTNWDSNREYPMEMRFRVDSSLEFRSKRCTWYITHSLSSNVLTVFLTVLAGLTAPCDSLLSMSFQ